MGGPRLSRSSALLALVALVALACCAAGPADAAPGQPRLPGRPVVANADPAQAPRIGTGRFVVRLPRGRSTYLRLERTAPGTTLHVGGQLIGRGGSIGEGFDLDVGTRPGRDSCGSAVAFRPTTGERAPVLYAATSTWTSDATHPCSTARTLYVRIRPPTDAADAGRPLQLRVYEEPPVDRAAFSVLTTPSPPVWSELEPGVARAVRPGHDVDDAPVVRDGTYAVSIRPGEDAFLAVPADWGDTLRVQLDAELPAALDPADPGLGLHLLGPLLDRADTGSLGTDPDIGPTRDRRAYRTGAMSQPLSYVNRDSVDPSVNGADLAGIHYVALDYVPMAAGVGPLSVRLTVQTLPGDGTTPLYGEVAGVHPPLADSRLVDGSLDRTPPAPHGPGAGSRTTITEDTGFPWLTTALVLGGLAVVGLLIDGWAHLRRRRRDRHPGRHRG